MVGTSLRDIYRDLTDPDHGFVLGEWSFLSAKEIAERSESYKPKMLDIGVKYLGMGHVIVISYIPGTDRFFLRRDGGSNGWEREEYYNKYSDSKFVPSEIPVYARTQTNKELREPMSVQYSYRDLMHMIDPSWVR